jgi:uncharacterized protein YejL (UPF0352 family)
MIPASLRQAVANGFSDQLQAAIDTDNVDEARSVVWAAAHALDESQIDDAHYDEILADFYAFNDCL